MQSPLRFAVIGCGAIARSKHLPNLAASRKACIHTCVDIDENALAVCRERFRPEKTDTDYRRAIRDPDVDAICLSSPGSRLPFITAAAEAGKPIYVEKPLGLTLAEIFQIQKVVKQSGIRMCVGHNRRSSPAMEEAYRIFRAHMRRPNECPWRFDRNPAARPLQPDDSTAVMNVRINDDWYSWKEWIFDPALAANGIMLCEMTHFTDLCSWFLDAEPKEVVAMKSGLLNAAVIIRFATGELATITMAGNGTFGYPKELYEIMGNGGMVAVDHMAEIRTAGIMDAPGRKIYPLLDDLHQRVGTEGGISGWIAKKAAACADAARLQNPLKQFTAEPDKGHAHALDRFVDEIRGVGPVVCGVDEAVMATRIAFAAIRSAAEQRIVAMSEVDATANAANGTTSVDAWEELADRTRV